MDNQNNDQNVNNQNTDMRSVEPTVIGHLRKDKIGDPVKVIVLGILLITVLFSLPFVAELLQEETGNQITRGNTITTQANSYAKGDENHQLNSSLVMKLDNIVMRNFSISGNSIICKINSYNGVLDLDKSNYYLVISSKQGNELGYIKLTGKYDYQETEVSLSSSKINFNNTMTYFGRIIEMKEEDYPEFKITPNVEGKEVLTCSKDNRVLTYTFANNMLINIQDQQVIKTKEFKSIDLYVTEKGKYESKRDELGVTSVTVEEGQDGFVYRADILLNNNSIQNIDYDYFDKGTDAKVVDFVLISKGYDCK